MILSGFSGGGYQYSNGISVFFPWSREGYEVSRKNYESLWFTRQAAQKKFSWAGFLKKYLNEVAIRKVEPETPPDAPPGSKYRYSSGIRFDERPAATTDVGQDGPQLAGQEGSKMAGQEGSKMAGQEGSKMAGQEGPKLAGQEGSKMAGQEGSKLGGGGSNAFFSSLRLFKNIESRWDISGFTKKAEESVPGKNNADG